MKKGTCENCLRPDVWVNTMTWGAADPMECCADCFEIVKHDEPTRNPSAKSSGTGHNNPWQDNAIRALEGD